MIKRTSPHKWPYQNLDIEDMRGEIWKSIPGYEDYYMVSNFGRIKSLDREVPHPKSIVQFVPQRIRKQKIHINKFILKKGKPTVDLSVALSWQGKNIFINVRRLVYAAFKKPLDFSKDRLVVINIDNNGYNNHISNLAAVTESHKSKRSAERGRFSDYLKRADRSKWKKSTTLMMPVQQVSLKTSKVIRSYESISEASRKTGFDEKGISQAARKLCKQWGGYRWRFSKKKN